MRRIKVLPYSDRCKLILTSELTLLLAVVRAAMPVAKKHYDYALRKALDAFNAKGKRNG